MLKFRVYLRSVVDRFINTVESALSEKDKAGSFGRLSALPFIFSAWLIGSIYGIRVALFAPVLLPSIVLEVVWRLVLAAALMFGGSKTLSVINDVGKKK